MAIKVGDEVFVKQDRFFGTGVVKFIDRDQLAVEFVNSKNLFLNTNHPRDVPKLRRLDPKVDTGYFHFCQGHCERGWWVRVTNAKKQLNSLVISYAMANGFEGFL